MKEFDYIELEQIDSVAHVKLSRPKAKNALNKAMRIEIGRIFERLEGDTGVRGVIVSGSHGNFCCGGDVKEMQTIDCPYEAEALSVIEQNVFRKIETISKPVIAAIEGFALGAGFDLALSCDIRIASENAAVGFPEVKLGFTVGGGGVHKLVRVASAGVVKELLFTGDIVSARRACEIGIINKTTNDNVIAYAHEMMVNRILVNSGTAIAQYKNLLHENDRAYAALIQENQAIGRCFRTRDRVEGINAFIEKRKPLFN